MTDRELVAAYHTSLESIARIVANVNGFLTQADIYRRDSYEHELRRRHLSHVIEDS